MKKEKSALSKVVKPNDAEMNTQIARYEKRELNLKLYGLYAVVIGIIGLIISMALEESVLQLVFFVITLVGGVIYYLGVRLRKKTESLVNAQLGDFYETELERNFGPRMNTSKMCIDLNFLKKIRPLEQHLYWDRCKVWRFYEGNYHGTHFSAANVELYYLDTDYHSNKETIQTVFKGFVLRCKDVCDPALDIVLRGHGADHRQCDLMDPAVFCQHFSARTADDQPAEDLVTPQLRELIRKLETLNNREMVDLEVQQIRKRLKGAAELERKHKKLGAGLVDNVYEDIQKMEARANYLPITALILHDGEATLAINEFIYADVLNDSLQNLDLVRRRFTVSLPPVCEMIDILRDFGGKL